MASGWLLSRPSESLPNPLRDGHTLPSGNNLYLPILLILKQNLQSV